MDFDYYGRRFHEQWHLRKPMKVHLNGFQQEKIIKYVPIMELLDSNKIILMLTDLLFFVISETNKITKRSKFA
jgi:hypothetical protein